jgi:hypothetical protein
MISDSNNVRLNNGWRAPLLRGHFRCARGNGQHTFRFLYVTDDLLIGDKDSGAGQHHH